MTSTQYISDFTGHPLDQPWIMVIGGVTRQGNRRARRACSDGTAMGHQVVWFDGFGETYPGSQVPVPLEIETGEVLIFPYSALEEQTMSRRLIDGEFRPRSRLAGWLWHRVISRIGLIMRPRAGWNALEPILRSLAASSPAPARIVYCDDYSLTTAWHAGKIWPTTPIGITARAEPL